VNDLSAVKIAQAIENSFGDLAQNLFAGSSAEFSDFSVDAVQAAALAELHSNGDGAGGLIHERTIVKTDVFGSAVLVEVEFSDDLFLDIGIGVGRDDLDNLINNPIYDYMII
jgi:hypothetical protein